MGMSSLLDSLLVSASLFAIWFIQVVRMCLNMFPDPHKRSSGRQRGFWSHNSVWSTNNLNDNPGKVARG